MTLRSLVPPVVTFALAASLALLPRLFAATPPPGPMPHLAPEGELAYEVRDVETGKLIPAKLTFLGVEGSPDPEFTRIDIARQEGDAIVAYNRLMSLTGLGAAHVPRGTYDIYISLGPEWDLYIARKVRITDRPTFVRTALRHVVDAAGFVSADFHVHANCSTDSHVPMHDRVYEFIADGVGLITSTDHNAVCNYGPIIAELGVGRYLGSLTGEELTTGGWGHHGVFPLPQNVDRAGHGAIHVHGRTAAEMFHEIHQSYPDALIDVHHPRIDNEIGYFNLGRLDSASDRAGRPGFSFDFDAVEVLNGYQDSERRSIDRVINDWFALINHGHVVTATGNSDTHHLTYNLGGYPRNYVRVLDSRPMMVTPLVIARAMKGHHSFFSTGPFVRLTVGGAGVGDVVHAPGGKARADIEVQAAAWVAVTTVTLYVNGHEEKRWAVPAGTARVRFKDHFDVQASRDAWVVVRVDGDRPLAPVVGDTRHYDVRPLALTNPVFLDVDGNGVFDPLVPHGPHVAGAEAHRPSHPAHPVKASALHLPPRSG